MSLPPTELARLLRMQQLCDQLIEQTRRLAGARELILALNQSVGELDTLYQQHWQRLVMDERLSAGDEAAIRQSIVGGGHSVLGQDTVWNALQDASELAVELAELLRPQAGGRHKDKG